MQHMQRIVMAAFCLAVAAACGGGGSGSSGDPVGPIPVNPDAEPLAVQDTLPAADATTVDPGVADLSLSHLGFSDFSFTYTGVCTQAVAVAREVEALNDLGLPVLYDHKYQCNDLPQNQANRVLVQGQRDDGSRFESELTFSTGVPPASGLTVLDSVSSPRAAVEDAFAAYVAGALTTELDLPAAVQSLVAAALVEVFASWVNLSAPGAVYGVTSQRVSYASRDPAGNSAAELTGLVVMPDNSGAFTPRDQIIVLSHATGSTPGDLDPTNAWFLLANVLASHGYLVLAPDNWGRGGTAAQAETYLLANRTAANSLDLIRRVLADASYDGFRNTAAAPRLTVIGYSQGGHSALAVWQAAVTQAADEFTVDAVFAGAGPYNMQQTFQGVLQHLDGSCNNGEYCRYADTETTVPFAVNRILPGFVAYTNTGLSLDDIVDGDTLAAGFVSGFLAEEAQYDALKLRLQQSSFTNISNAAQAFAASEAQLTLYHSPFDRLVPEANTRELAALLGANQPLTYQQALCSSPLYETIFNLTDFVGIVHTLCGLAMMDEVVGQLR